MRYKYATAGLLALSIALTGCSSDENQASPGSASQVESSPTPALPAVSQDEVTAAIKTLQHKVDDFTSDETVTYEIPMSVYSSGGNGMRGTLAGQFQRKAGGAWTFQLAASYVGSEWLFFNSVNIRSNSKTYEYTVDHSNKFEKVLGGGSVAEIGPVFLTQAEAIEMLSLAKDGEIKFRLNGSGSGSGSDFTGVLSAKMKKQLINVLTAYLGTEQGLAVY